MKKAPVTSVAGAFSFHVCAPVVHTHHGSQPRKGRPRVVGSLLLRDNNHGVAGRARSARGTGRTRRARGAGRASGTTAGASRAGRTRCTGVAGGARRTCRTRSAGGASFASRAGRTRNGHHGRRRRDHRAVTSGQTKGSDQSGEQNGIFHGSLSEFERKMRAKLCAGSFSCLGLVLPKIISG